MPTTHCGAAYPYAGGFVMLACGRPGCLQDIGYSMGHTLLGELKRTRQYKQVVSLLAGGAEAHQIAQAVIQLAECRFNLAADDKVLVETIHLLMQLPIAARSNDFVAALHEQGIDVSGVPSANELIAAVVETVDNRFPGGSERTDLGEIAQVVAAEALSGHLKDQLGLLYDSARPEDVQGVLKAMYTPKNFGEFSRKYIAGVTQHVLNYFLGTAMSEVTGGDERFPTLAASGKYKEAIKIHTYEAAKIVERFSGEWYSQVNQPSKGLNRDQVGKYAYGAFQKINKELKAGL